MTGSAKLYSAISMVAVVAAGAGLMKSSVVSAPPARSAVEVSAASTDAGPSTANYHPEVLARAEALGRTVSPETLALASRLQWTIDGGRRRNAPPVFCYAPGTSDEAMQLLWGLVPELNPALRYQFSDGSRWSPGAAGDPIVLTYSFVPDGLSVDGGISEVFSRLDAQFGSRALWMSRVQAAFDRWAELSGTSYVKVSAAGVDWDDGAAWGTNGGPERGDVRIAMIDIDGGSNILAYNYFPNFGEMVLDRSESWGVFSANNHRFFRNVLMHEHGHGLGFSHVCPIIASSNGRLMEPFINTQFDGPTHDELRAAHRGYGDAFEPNDSSATATDVGNVIFGSPIVVGTVPSPSVNLGSTTSLDHSPDEDYFKFSVIAESTVSISLNPLGFHYDSSPQACGSEVADCCFFNFIDSDLVFDLNLQLIDSNGVDVLATADTAPIGQPETLTDVALPNSPGSYYIRVYTPDVANASQLYNIDLSVVTVGADISTPQPDPLAFESPPLPTSTNEISMTAALASDATEPIKYQFDFVGGSTGGGPDSVFQTSRTFTDTGLQPNRNYTYRVRSQDSAPSPGPNTGAFSANVTGTTHIETPAGVMIGTVTDTTVQMSATGIISFFTVDQSGLFFDSIDPSGDDGINEWIQVNDDTAINLTPDTEYQFQAKARNRNAIETVDFSPATAVRTLAAVPGAPLVFGPGSVSMYLNVDPAGNPSYTGLAVHCVSTSPFDANWDGMYADAAANPSAGEVWVNDVDWGTTALLGLQPDTTYTFEVKARNADLVETAFGPSAGATTTSAGTCALRGDINTSSTVTSVDIAGFVRVKMGVPDGGDAVDCADFGHGDVELDTADFVDVLLN